MSHPSSSAPATLTSILIMYDYNVYSQKIPCIFTCRHHSLSPGEETSFTVQNHLSYLLISPHSKHPRLFALPGQKQPTHANTQRRRDSGHGPPDSGSWLPLGSQENALDSCGHLSERSELCPQLSVLSILLWAKRKPPGIPKCPGPESHRPIPSDTMNQPTSLFQTNTQQQTPHKRKNLPDRSLHQEGFLLSH